MTIWEWVGVALLTYLAIPVVIFLFVLALIGIILWAEREKK